MKIIHILPNLKGGGIQNLLLSLAPMQAKMDNDVTLIVIDKDKLDYSHILRKKIESNGVKVFYLNRKVSSLSSSFYSLIVCYKLIHKLNVDIVNSHGAFCHIFAALCVLYTKSKHLPTIHNAPERWNKLCFWLNNKKPIIYCSQAALDENSFVGNPNVVIPNGVDKDMVVTDDKSALRQEFGLNKHTKLVVGVGSLRPQKNYAFWVKLANACKDIDVHFFICGGHYGKDYIDPIIFGGLDNLNWLSVRSDVPKITNECDCFLSCSTIEGLPIAVLEAYFSGIPCVLSPIQQHINIANHVSECYIPDEFTVISFKAKIKEACFSNKSHEIIREERKNIIKKYSIDKTAKKYIDFYAISI